MKSLSKLSIAVFFLLLFNSCQKEKEIDVETPEIDISIADAFPVNCDTIYFGNTFILKVRFTDNVELGSFSIDIHHNFDHHSHSTEVTECNLSPVKVPDNPYLSIEDYDIPDGETDYTTNLSIELPYQNNSGQFDEGDYHFFISLTDKNGWSTQKGLSIKILHHP